MPLLKAAPPAASTPTRRALVSTKPAKGPTEQFPALLAGLVADDALQLADDVRVGMGPDDRSDAVVRRLDCRHPVPQRLVYGVFQGPAARVHSLHLGPEQLHAEHVQALALDVDGAHVDEALEAEQSRRGGSRDTVLAGTGLGDKSPLAHTLGQQRLAEDIVDLVRARMGKVLAL
jgi:hypothetical protein